MRGGGKRSVSGVDQAVSLINKNSALIGDLLKAVKPDKEAFNMRALDAIEKASRKNVELLRDYKNLFLDKLIYSQQKEIRWHVTQIIPRLELTKKERICVIDILITDYLNDKSSIVKTSALQALTDLAMLDNDLIKKVKSIIVKSMKTGTPAMIARGAKLLSKLKEANR